MGQAFPDLTFLHLEISNKELLDDLISGNRLFAQNFPNLKALWISSSSQLSSAEMSSSQHSMNLDFVPQEMQFLCIDGSLLSQDNLYKYDGMRYMWKRIKGMDLDVAFTGYGYACNGARGVLSDDYYELEKYWNKSDRKEKQ